MRADQVLALVGVDLDRAAALEADPQPADDRALELRADRSRATVPSTRLASGVVKTSSVGMFATCSIPLRDVEGREPGRVGQEPDRQVGARAAVAQGVEPALVQARRRGATSSRDVLLPGRDRVGLVEPDRGRDRLPEPVDVGLAEHACVAQPSFGYATIDQLQRPSVSARLASASCAHPGSPEAAAVEAVEELRLGVAGDREQRAAVLAEVVQPLDEPRRRPAELSSAACSMCARRTCWSP